MGIRKRRKLHLSQSLLAAQAHGGAGAGLGGHPPQVLAAMRIMVERKKVGRNWTSLTCLESCLPFKSLRSHPLERSDQGRELVGVPGMPRSRKHRSKPVDLHSNADRAGKGALLPLWRMSSQMQRLRLPWQRMTWDDKLKPLYKKQQ